MITVDHRAHLLGIAQRDNRYARFLSLPIQEIARPLEADCPFTRPAIRFDETNLCPEPNSGLRFNPSIIENRERTGYIFSYRTGWAGSHICLVRLDADFKPQGEPTTLKLKNKHSRYGREDSRLFRLNGHLHIMYIGVLGSWGPTNVCFARINEETFAVEDKFHPRVPGRQSWEKNHAYFDYQGVAHTVYKISPHRILRVEGNTATFVAETSPKLSWSGGRMCGGASPVLHEGEWWHFFHGSTEWNGRRQYNMGCVCFSPEPPFGITRFTPHPLDVADPTVPHPNHCDVLFPGGAVRLEREWVIAHGIHDRWSELRFYSSDWVSAQLEEV